MRRFSILLLLACSSTFLNAADTRLSWTHQLTDRSQNSCCQRSVASIKNTAFAEDDSEVDYIEFNFDFPLASSPRENPLLEAYWCISPPDCENQRIYRVFLQTLSEYKWENGKLGAKVASVDVNSNGFSEWQVTSEVVGEHTIQTLTSNSSLLTFWASYSTTPGAVLANGVVLPLRSVKFGFRVNAEEYKWEDASNVLVLEASIGSKGTVSEYVFDEEHNQVSMVGAIYGEEETKFSMAWEDSAVFDGVQRRISTVVEGTDAYLDTKFVLGDSSFAIMDWDPKIGVDPVEPVVTVSDQADDVTDQEGMDDVENKEGKQTDEQEGKEQEGKQTNENQEEQEEDQDTEAAGGASDVGRGSGAARFVVVLMSSLALLMPRVK